MVRLHAGSMLRTNDSRGMRESAPAYSRRQLLANAGHGSLPVLGVAVSRRAALLVREDEGPHPWASHGRGVGLEDAADNFGVGEHVEIFVIPFAGWARG